MFTATAPAPATRFSRAADKGAWIAARRAQLIEAVEASTSVAASLLALGEAAAAEDVMGTARASMAELRAIDARRS